MTYQEKRKTVEAWQLPCDVLLAITAEKIQGHKDDWLVMADGEMRLVPDAEFKAKYELVETCRITWWQ